MVSGTDDNGTEYYSATSAAVKFEITQATLTATYAGETITYGETYSKTNPTYTNVGTYTVYYKVSRANYSDVTGSAKLTITGAAETEPTTESGTEPTKESGTEPTTESGTAAESETADHTHRWGKATYTWSKDGKTCGTCYIYVVANNGCYKKVKVTVK